MVDELVTPLTQKGFRYIQRNGVILNDQYFMDSSCIPMSSKCDHVATFMIKCGKYSNCPMRKTLHISGNSKAHLVDFGRLASRAHNCWNNDGNSLMPMEFVVYLFVVELSFLTEFQLYAPKSCSTLISIGTDSTSVLFFGSYLPFLG